jgi:hypothetical protein
LQALVRTATVAATVAKASRELGPDRIAFLDAFEPWVEVDLGGDERLLCVHGTRESYDLETFRCATLENGMPHGAEAVRRLA